MAANLTNLSSLCAWPSENILPYNVQNYPVKYFELVLYPILLFVCTTGNVGNILVLSTEKEKTTTNVYLTCVAVADLFILWLGLPEYIINVTNEKILENERFSNNYENYFGFGKWLSETCVQFSDWTLILFSLERFMAVARPFHFPNWHTIPIVVTKEIVLLFLASIFTLQNLVSWYYFLAHDDGTSSANQIFPPALIKWAEIQNQAEIGITIAKWLTLTVITAVFMLFLAKQSKFRSDIVSRDPDSERTFEANYKSSNYILIASVLLYFVTQFPNVVYKCMEVASQPPYCTYNLTRRERTIARPFVFIATMSNYSLDFFVYCTASKKYRAQLKVLLSNISQFCCPRAVKPDQDLDYRRGSTDTVLSQLSSSRHSGSLDTAQDSLKLEQSLYTKIFRLPCK